MNASENRKPANAEPDRRPDREAARKEDQQPDPQRARTADRERNSKPNRTNRRAGVALALFAALASGAPLQASPPGGAPDWTALIERREVLVREVVHPDGIAGLHVEFAVRAPRAQAWDALRDYEHFPEIFDGIERMRVLHSDAAGSTVEFWADAVLRDVHYVLERRYEEPQQRVRWRRVSGDLERIEGSWTLRETPRPDVLLLAYESFVDVGYFLPSSLVRWLAKSRARRMAERLRAWLEARAPPRDGSGESGGDPDAARGAQSSPPLPRSQ